jgi:hypothetical protein
VEGYLDELDPVRVLTAAGDDPSDSSPRGHDSHRYASAHPRAVGLGTIGEGLPWIDRWIETAIALNELSASLGSDDAYPFTLTPPVIEKLELIDRLVAGRSSPCGGASR